MCVQSLYDIDVDVHDLEKGLKRLSKHVTFSMSTAIPNPPVTPIRPTVMASQTEATDMHRKLKESSSQVDLKESVNMSEALAIREPPDKIEIPASQPPPVIKDVPASRVVLDQNEHDSEANSIVHEIATSPQASEPFDWDDFQARYDQAMAEAKAKDDTLLNEFNELARVGGLSLSSALSY